MPEPVVPFDLQRMLFGDMPMLFLIEIIVRTLIVYGYGLLLLRWLGSRTIGQLSTVEFLLVIALGSAVGDAMFYPEVPLLHALLVVTVVVFANKGLDILIARSKIAERAIDGEPQEVLRDGVICTAFLHNSGLGVSELFQQLRHRDIEHLGQVAEAYIEADGVVTVFRAREPRPGLPVAPPWEVERPPQLPAGARVESGPLACLRCGNLSSQLTVPGPCDHCGHEGWTHARTRRRFAEQAGD